MFSNIYHQLLFTLQISKPLPYFASFQFTHFLISSYYGSQCYFLTNDIDCEFIIIKICFKFSSFLIFLANNMQQTQKKSSFWQSLLDWIKSKFFNKELEIALVGLQNAGKTTLVNTMATGQFEENTIPTIGFNHRNIKKGKVQFKMWDLGGQARFREQWEKYCRTADVIIFVVDSHDVGNMDIARAQLNQLLSWPSLEAIPLLLLGNKNDKEGALNQEQVIIHMDLKNIKDRKVACFSISAKDNVNIDVMLKWLSSLEKQKQ